MKAAGICLLMMLSILMACKGQTDDEVKTTISHTKEPQKDVENMLTEFYTAYITTTADSIAASILEKKLDSIIKIYCTPALLDSIDKAYADGLDFDPFLNAQDCDMDMLNSLQVQQNSNIPKIFYVHYSTPGYDSKFTTIELSVAKTGDTYKIAGIK